MIVERNTRGRREKQGGLLKSAKNTLGEHGARESRVKKLVEVVKDADGEILNESKRTSG